MTTHYAEDMSYWDTEVHLASSQGDIIALLEVFGAMAIDFRAVQGRGKFGWIIRFEYDRNTYRFYFEPYSCHNPERQRSLGRGKGYRLYSEQAKLQMGRRAFHLIKAILNVAADDPELLTGKMEVPGTEGGPGGLPATVGELDLSRLNLKALPAPADITIENP